MAHIEKKVFETEEDVLKLIKKHQTVLPWVTKAREAAETLRALVYGDKFDEILIKKIEKLESGARAEARKKYSKDIRDMFNRALEPRTNVFSASGGSVNIEIKSKTTKEKLVETLKSFKGNKSITKYLSEYFFQLLDVDPNGLIMLEYIEDQDIYPAYKSINDIRYYHSDGQNVNFVIFEPKKEFNQHKKPIKVWRVIDSAREWYFIQDGDRFTFDKERSFEHPFKQVPAVILSDLQKLGTETRLSPLFPVEELAKDYARDKSVLTVYKFLQGFPIHWRYNQQCRPCKGTGKTGKESCTHCSGNGFLGKNDVTDVLNVPMPREDDPKIAPDLAGFVSPDLKTWEQYNKDLLVREEQIDNTLWGTHRKREAKGSETATGRYIDVQPVINKLNDYSDNVEWVHNMFVKWVLLWIDKANTDNQYHRSYGRRFIMEGPDVLLERYETSREAQNNSTILDKLLDEYLLSKYKNDPILLAEMVKKAKLEPYVHLTLNDVNDIFGNKEAQRKQLFGPFWEQADKTKEIDVLAKDFDTFVKANIINEPIQPIEEPKE